MDPIVIVGAARTPMGGFLGDFKDVGAPSSAPAPSPRRCSGRASTARTPTRS